MRTLNAAAVILPDDDNLHVTQLGIDEHRCRRSAGTATLTPGVGGGSSRG